MGKNPKGIKGFRRKLQAAKTVAIVEMKRAMREASIALDQQAQEIIALKRILISERAQVIYYTSKYESFIHRACAEVRAVGFLDLPEAEQEVFVKRAVKELSDSQGLVPHDADAAAAADEMHDTAKKLILPN